MVAGWVIRRKVRGSWRPRAGRKLGTGCDRVARIECRVRASAEIYEILRVLLVREDSVKPRL
jgi:hypothetical protein